MIIIPQILKNSILRRYLSLVLNHIDGTIVRERYFQFRCLECGDSKKNKFKKRGYLLFHKDRWSFKCHNCSISMSAEKWLKKHFPIQYKAYIVELLQNQTQIEPEPIKYHSPIKKNLIEEKKKISNEEKEISTFVPIHRGTTDIFKKAIEFCVNRKIPEEVWYDWYVSTKGKYGGRIIIPFYDNDKIIYHYQARTLGKQIPKYLNRVDNAKIDSIYNKYFVDRNSPIIVQEGPINSLFVENSIATCGLSFADDFLVELEKLGELWFLFDYDDPGQDKARKLLKEGKTVFLWKKFAKELALPNRPKWDFNDLCLYTGQSLFNIGVLKPFFTKSNFDSIWI